MDVGRGLSGHSAVKASAVRTPADGAAGRPSRQPVDTGRAWCGLRSRTRRTITRPTTAFRPVRSAWPWPARGASSTAGGDGRAEAHHAARMPRKKPVAVPAAEGGVGAGGPAARTPARCLMNDGESLSGPAADVVAREEIRRSGTRDRPAGRGCGSSSKTGVHRTSISPIRRTSSGEATEVRGRYPKGSPFPQRLKHPAVATPSAARSPRPPGRTRHPDHVCFGWGGAGIHETCRSPARTGRAGGWTSPPNPARRARRAL